MNRNLSEQTIQDLLQETTDSEPEDVDEFRADLQDEADDISDAETEVSDHNTESELSEDEEQDEVQTERQSGFFYGKNRYKWAENPPASSRTRAHNIIIHLPGIKGPALEKPNMTLIEAWSLLISSDILNSLVEYTNQKITMSSENSTANVTYTNHVDIEEMRAFIGLMFLCGIFKSGRENVQSLWSTKVTGRPIFRTVMSLNRFLFLLSCLCFDDLSTREQRKLDDPLALISEIFHAFIANCQANYSCSEYLTVDEMLVSFRGRCKFRVYIKSKPGRYGIKIQCLCDAKTFYLFNAFIYHGKENTSREDKRSVPTRTVMKLAKPIYGTNRNITGDTTGFLPSNWSRH